MVLGIIPNLSDGGNLDFGSISGYPKFCSSWKTPRELCHILGNCFEFHLISFPFPFIPSLSKESAWIPTPAPWEIPKWIKNVFYLFFGDILEVNGIIWERANNWKWHFVVSKGWTFPALMIPWSHIFCAKTQKKTKLTLLISIWPEKDLLRLFGVIKICFKRVNHYNFKT